MQKEKGMSWRGTSILQGFPFWRTRSYILHTHIKEEEKTCSGSSNRTSNYPHQDPRRYRSTHGSSTSRSPEKTEGQQWRKVKKTFQKAGHSPFLSKTQQKKQKTGNKQKPQNIPQKTPILTYILPLPQSLQLTCSFMVQNTGKNFRTTPGQPCQKDKLARNW